MARQKSVVQFSGSIGNLTFYKTKDGFMARQRTGGLTKNQIETDPKFIRIRENLSEFRRVGEASKIIREGLREQLVGKADRVMTRRLRSALMSVLRSDAINDRGLRLVQAGNTEPLLGFEFNEGGRVSASTHVAFTASLDRVGGVFSLDIPAFIPVKMIERPEGSTHCRFNLIAFSLDLDDRSFLKSVVETGDIELSTVQQEPIALSTQLPPDLDTLLFLMVGVDFYQKIGNGKMYSLENGAYNGLKIELIDQVLVA